MYRSLISIKLISLFLVASAFFITSCNKKSEDSKTTTGVDFLPSVLDMVDKASPATFSATQASSGVQDDFSNLATAAEASEALKDFFTDNVTSISGLTNKGLVRAYLKDLESRVTEIEQQSSAEPSCFTSTPVSFTFDAGVSSQTLTAKLSCVRKFGGSGDKSGAGSGLAFGQDDTYKYLYLLLVQTNGTDKFGYIAKMNKSTEEVDLLFLQYFPGSSRTQFFRLKTNPTSKKYELVYAGTSDGPGPSQTNTAHGFGPGVRLVTSSSEIKVEGSVATQTTSTGTATTTYAFDSTQCFSTSSLSTAPTTCSGSAPSFSSDMALVAASSMPAAATTINTSLKVMSDLVTGGAAEF